MRSVGFNFVYTSLTLSNNRVITTFQHRICSFLDVLAIAEEHNNEGDKEFRNKEYDNAIDFYTEGIKLECEDKELKAKLYSNRATAHCFLGK